MDVLRDFAALQMLIFRAVGLANPTEQANLKHFDHIPSIELEDWAQKSNYKKQNV